MFITEEDYRVVIGDAALKVISQVSEENRANAEAEAREEISGYLRPKYDCGAVFAAEGNDRNRLVVMYTCDIALYHMSAAMPQKMGSEIREERYKRAIEWLESVQAGKIIPDLPLAVDGNGTPTGDTFVYSSQTKLRHNW
ncbi:phage protein Gp36 family protein [Bacteroides sp. AN502(2024)]|uniref:phage protein Gp36 family protein n=1 Tax=Bacteroides sp. AN502(2024) TaxID=3160599 RepID=UPI0035124369